MVTKLSEPMVHGCGRAFDQPNTYAIHAKHCDGKKVPTRGRIERLAGRAHDDPKPRPSAPPPHRTPPASVPPQRTIVTIATPGGGSGGAVSGRVVQPSTVDGIAAAATAQAMELTIAGLLTQRAKIDTAIAALEALRA